MTKGRPKEIEHDCGSSRRERIVESGVRFLLHHRLIVLMVMLLITVLAGFQAVKLTFDSSIQIWFLEDDPDLLTYQAFLERFHADEMAVVGVFAEDIFTPETLELVDRISKAAARVPYAHRVRSLSNIRIARNEDDAIRIGPLIPKLPKTRDGAHAIRKEALGNPLLDRMLVSHDGKATAILVELTADGNSFAGKTEMTDALEAILKKEKRPGVSFAIAGSPPLDRAFLSYSKRDSMIFGPAAILLVILTTFLVFRRISAAIVPLSVVLVALTWLYGIMGFLGLKINIVSTSLLALVLAVGIADSIHVVSEYYQRLTAGEPKDEAVVRTITGLLSPCFFTSATTAAGFLSLVVSDLKPIREFGILAALGVSLAFIVSIVLIPCILTMVRRPDTAYMERQKHDLFSKLLPWLGRPTRRRSHLVFWIFLAFVLVSVYGITRIEVGANPLEYFRRGEPVREETLAVDRALAGSGSVEFLVTTKPEGLKDPDTLKRLDTFERWLETQPGITRALSIVDSLKDLNRVFSGKNEVPDSRALAAQFYLLLESEDDFDSLLQDDYDVARITARVRLSDANDLSRRVHAIEQKEHELFSKTDVKIKGTGFIKLMGDMEDYLVESQVRSFVIAFVVITLMMMLLLRSLRLGLFSMIPNVTPVLMGLGFMAAARIELNPGTVMIGGMALGLVVDDTVHFLVRLRRFLAEEVPLEESIRRTMQDTGRPIVVTSVVLSAGFSILTFGSFAPNIYYGGVSAIVIILALLADLLMLPASLLLCRKAVPLRRRGCSPTSQDS